MNTKDPLIDTGICRCCGNSKKCRSLIADYVYHLQTEVYCDIFVECFGLLLSHLDGEPGDRLICATCVSRLREASTFKRQVLLCEEKLLQSRIILHEDGVSHDCKTEMPTKEESVEKSQSKFIDHENDMDMSQDDKQADGIPDGKRLPPPIDTWNNKEKSLHITELSSLKEVTMIKRDTRIKLSSKRKLSSTERLSAKRQLLKKMQRTRERLQKLQHVDTSPKLPETAKERPMDDDFLSFHNNATLVENSFVCPFHTSYSYYSCVYCKTDFMDPEKLREHSLKHDPVKFRTFYSGKPVYFDIERIDCRLCDMKITDIDTFKAHITEKHGKVIHEVKDNILKFRLRNGPITCTDCSKSFIYFHALKRHMAEHSGLFVCDVCGSHFFDRHSLEMHNRKSHRELEEITCEECGKPFKSKHNLLYHISSVHKKQPAYQCSKCDLALFSQSDRHKHLLEVHGESRGYSCETCGKQYTSMKTLGEHNRTVHLKIFKHRCSICERGFALPSRLKEHIMSTHRGERNYHCEYCGKSYPRLHYLKLHLQSHTE